MSKIAYITAKSPFSLSETFILTEMLAMKKLGANLIIIPRDRSRELFHKEAEALLGDTLLIPWFNIKIALMFPLFAIRNPLLFLRLIYDIVLTSGNAKIAVKNLVILPKALYTAKILKKTSISHIHAHWASTTATMAHVISKITGIPWSFTAHRWDIKENNLLRLKVKSALFTRCISAHGKKMMLDNVGKEYESKIKILYMGVNRREHVYSYTWRDNLFRIAVPANLYFVKGHKYLIDACNLLKNRNIENFTCIFYGNGYLKNELIADIDKKTLTNHIRLPGQIPNEKLIELYETRKVDAVVLPSINTENGDHEGIPVCLMEAMAYGIPVISTNTGGIPELIGDGSGIMVKEKDSEAIAHAIETLMNDENIYRDLAEKGRNKVNTSFDIEVIAHKLLSLFFQGEEI